MSDLPQYDEILKNHNITVDRPLFRDIYNQGRADAIEEFIKYYENGDCICCDKQESDEPFVCIKCMAEKFKLKEKKND